jgi:transcriptional regulator with XRE-family HTH domain
MLATVAKRQPQDIDRLVGENLRRLRTEKGLSQFDLADSLDVSVIQLQKYEMGRNRISAARLYRSAQALGVALDDLFAGCGA